MGNNRSVKRMDRINTVANSQTIEAPLREYYPVGLNHERAAACPPLMVLHCLLLGKFFHLLSDSDSEDQMKDKIPPQKFLCLPFAKPFPDHSIFSRLTPGKLNQRCCRVHRTKTRQIALKRASSEYEGGGNLRKTAQNNYRG